MPELVQAKPTHQIHAMLNRVIESDYPYLNRLQPPVDLRIVLATPDKAGNAAVKNGKRAVTAFLDIVPSKWRVRGAGDVAITIDTAEWRDLEPEEQEATLAGELESMEFVELREAGDGLICDLDDAGRPCIKKRPPDVVVSGYSAVIQRYGDAAEARKELDRANSRLRQQALPFGQHDVISPAESGTTTVSFEAKDFPVIAKVAETLRRTRKADVDEMFAAQPA